MSIIDYFAKGEQKRNYGLFSYLVRIAKVDDVVTEGEEKFLKKVAFKLNIPESKTEEIIKNPKKFPMNAPYSYEDRIERLYRLTQMIYADGTPTIDEVNIMKKAIVALGFPTDNVDKLASEAVHLVMNDNDLEDFTQAIKNVNKD